MMRMKRCGENPIVTPGIYDWRKATVFNPAAILDNGKFYMLERAAGSLRPHQCHIGLLSSDDGIHFTHVVDKPVFAADALGWPHGSVQDPRVVKIDGTFYMQCAVRPFSIHHGQPQSFRLQDYYEDYTGSDCNLTRSALATSKDLIHWDHFGFLTPEGVSDRDVILFPEKINGKYAMFRRPSGQEFAKYGKAIWVTYSGDLKEWSQPRLVAQSREGIGWESGKIGGSTPPIRTTDGWLVIYHGACQQNIYRVGAMLLDLSDPTIVLARTRQPVMEPQEDYEKIGPFIPNVIFPCGNVVRDGLLYLYYGCADFCIAVATVELDELVEYVKMCGGGTLS